MEPDTTPTQLAHPARTILRTLIASAIGVLVTLAARAGIDLATLAQPLVEALTAVAWAIATGAAQWVLTRPAIEAFLKRYAPGLATTPPSN